MWWSRKVRVLVTYHDARVLNPREILPLERHFCVLMSTWQSRKLRRLAYNFYHKMSKKSNYSFSLHSFASEKCSFWEKPFEIKPGFFYTKMHHVSFTSWKLPLLTISTYGYLQFYNFRKTFAFQTFVWSLICLFTLLVIRNITPSPLVMEEWKKGKREYENG